MPALETFLAYAADFETTLVDDDWARLAPYFHDDAVYRVESNLFGCELHGPAAIFAGLKKSLDGFDRRFSGREISLTEGPHAEGDELRAAWTVTYTREGLPPFVLRGRSFCRVRDDRIDCLVDAYDDAVAGEISAWIRQTGESLDPSYV